MLDNNYYGSNFRWRNFLFSWGQIDWFLLLLVIGLTVFAGLMIRSAELYDGQTNWQQHWIIGGIGLILALIIMRLRYEYLIQWHWLTYGLANLLLLIVPFLGTEVNGAKSWIRLGGFNLQPSEFGKLAIIITLAALLHECPASNLKGILRVFAASGVSCFLVMLQPDLGTTLVFGAITLGMLYWGNAKLGWVILMISPIVSMIVFNVFFPVWIVWAVLMGIIAWFTLPWRAFAAFGAVIMNSFAGKLGQVLWNLLKPYQQDRLILFLHPEKEPLDGGFQLIQSRIAIGSGQIWGKGLFHGTQTQLNFIPEQHTDFIFSAIGEELGFVGGMCILLVFWLICFRLIIIACNSKDNFGSLLAVGVLSMIIFQVVINISMTVGLAPITGIPLPWISYGGSSLLMNFMAIGLVESVYKFRQPPKRF